MSDSSTGTVNTDNSEFHGPVVGVNLGTIIYGRPPDEFERERLVKYLERLTNSHRTMRVVGLNNLNIEADIDLTSVYIMLAVQKRYRAIRNFTDAEIINHQQQKLKLPEEFKSDRWLPDRAIVNIANDKSRGWVWVRAELATETVIQNQYLVLCGAPGSGKSTFAKHLVWALAQRGLDQINQQTNLLGWSDKQRLLPIFMPLRQLAGALVGKDLGLQSEINIGPLFDAVCEYLHTQYWLEEPHKLLNAGLDRSHKVLFVFDGLDEVPLEATNKSIDRTSLLRFLRHFASKNPNARILITCRSRAWTATYTSITHWPMVTLAPLTGGQIVHFIGYWFSQLQAKNVISNNKAQDYNEQLRKALNDPTREKLRRMAENPLLLSMMIFVLAEKGKLPRDRHNLYEQMLEQLLEQWDFSRDGQTLGQAIGDERITSTGLRDEVLDQIAYAAHLHAISEDGRGRIEADTLKKGLMDYFASIDVSDPYRVADRCITHIDQRSGLVQPEDDGKIYTFAHLTLQEHIAGRYLLWHKSIEQILALRRDDRWREPIFLGVGCLKKSLKTAKLGLLLNALTNPRNHGQDKLKPINEWYRDLILAAELGKDHDWDLSDDTDIDIIRLKRKLRQGLAQLLNDHEHAQAALNYYYGQSIDPAPLLVKERQNAAELLAGLGDPRYPVHVDQWQQATCQLSQHFGREGNHYWRYVSAGCYKVGGWDTKTSHSIAELRPYWIGRFMLTIEQYQVFSQTDGYQDNQYWHPSTIVKKRTQQRTEPQRWNIQTQQEYLNQPVYGVSWYEAVAYCNWLTQRLREWLPQGYRVCLATEAEWEVAAAYNAQGQRQPYPWGKQSATPEHAVYNWSKAGRPLSVGLAAIGQAVSGVTDITGNLWEWTATPYWADNTQDQISDSIGDRMIVRGGAYYGNSADVLCMKRDRNISSNTHYYIGFRCVIAHREDIEY